MITKIYKRLLCIAKRQSRALIGLSVIICQLSFSVALSSCTDLDEKVYDRIDAGVLPSTDRHHRHWLARISSISQNTPPTRLHGVYGMPDSGVGTRP